MLTTVISTHGYIKNKTEIEVAVGCLESSLRPEEETTANRTWKVVFTYKQCQEREGGSAKYPGNI